MANHRKLPHTDLNVSPVGYGCMGLTSGYSSENGIDVPFMLTYTPVEADYKRAEAAIDTALAAGVNMFDTAEVYGGGANEKLLAQSIKKHGRDKFLVATKFVFVRDENGTVKGLSGKPADVLATAEKCLKNLEIDTIDLFYQHRMDPATPIEETVGAMAQLVREGKVRALGLSEAPASYIRRAHAVHPISAVQVEYSLWTRDIERNGVLATCRELGILVVAYSPVGRGMLTGKFKKPEDLSDSDWRRSNPRFQEENFAKNVQAVKVVEDIAAKHGCTASQVAIAWLLAQGNDIVPIPGSCNPKHIRENSESVNVKLTEDDLQQLNGLEATVSGARYDAQGLAATMSGTA